MISLLVFETLLLLWEDFVITLLVFETLLLLYEDFVITLLVFETIVWNLNYVYTIELGYCFL